MAASSSSAASFHSPKKYDVFISFRGEDTRSNFTSHLHAALCRNKIETYIDKRLEKGDEVWPSLEEAIEDSTLFLVIFSETYASSTWCLKELTKIQDCTKDQEKAQRVIPVFYRIEPTHVRKQSGSYQKAFEEYEQKKMQQVHLWREALTHAANLSGWPCSFVTDEAELIIKIMKDVITKLRDMLPRESDLKKDYVGICQKIRSVESLLNKRSPQDIHFIGIWGTGGIGKTTLARVVFDKMRPEYEACCFLENVKEESKRYGIAALKRKLISTLLGDEYQIGMLDEIRPHDMSRLGRKRSLIVLDDIDDQEQLENLARRHDWFGRGSKILITTRNKQILNKEVDDIYEVETLNCDESFHLFSLNAFKNGIVDHRFTGLAKNVISYANDIPLALKVLGSILYGKSHKEWESQLKKLKKMPNSKLHDVLKWSFEGLDDEEKNIFLDVACIFKGCLVEDIENMLDACGYSIIIGLKSLEDKALLNIYNGRVFMHDLVQEMSRKVIREESLKGPEKCSRLWNSNDIIQILKNNTGTEAIEAISLNLSEITEEMYLSPQAFCSMPNLKFLDFHGYFNDNVNKLHFPGGLEFQLNKLRLLRWERYPLKSLPVTIEAENLVTIEMPHSNLIKLWDGQQNLGNLRKIDLNSSKNLVELPDFSKATHLEHVKLTYCSNLGSVHPSILSLHSLKSLSLESYKALTSLTSNTHLKSLSRLNLRGCGGLKEFSVTSDMWNFVLVLSDTAISGELSSSSGHLSQIYKLFLDDCKSVTNLPYKLADLSKLRYLVVSGCKSLALNLRYLFRRLYDLEVFWLSNCSNIFELPRNVGMLSSLHELRLSGTDLENLPLSIKHLSSLQKLELSECRRLQRLPKLPPSVLWLSVRDCENLETIEAVLVEKEAKTLLEFDDDLCFDCGNCMKMDKQSIKVVEAKALLEMNKGIYSKDEDDYLGFVEVVYPGNKVPGWFTYTTEDSSITVDPFSFPHSWDCSFIFCAVVSKLPCETFIKLGWFINDRKIGSSSTVVSKTISDHVFFWHTSGFPPKVRSMIEKMETKGQSSSYRPSFEITFNVAFNPIDPEEASLLEDETVGEIRECGLCLTSAPEFQNYIKQMELALESQPNSIGMEVGRSYHNTHHKEAVSQKRKYHCFDEFEDMDSSEN